MHSSPSETSFRTLPSPDDCFSITEAGLPEAIVRCCGDAVFSLSEHGTFTSWNPAAQRFYGYAPAEVTGASAQILAPPEMVAEVTDLVARTLDGQTTVDLETRRRAKDGRIVAVSITAAPILDRHGRACGACEIHRDIGERKDSERRLAEIAADLEQRVQSRTVELEMANRDLREYAYMAAHDLRTPLRAIAGFATLLTENQGARLDEEGRRMLDVIRRNTEEVGRLIDSIVSLTREDRRTLARETVDMQALVASCIAELEGQRAGRSVDVCAGYLPECIGDPHLLRTVWLALLSNAQKFTMLRSHARIEIGSGDKDGKRFYYVSDDGVGFDMSNAQRVFELFQRAHRPAEYDGLGLGLAIASRIVERHGGRMWAHSQPGAGSTFYFTVGEE
ncbi:MAG TPA: ATP-binding protein [Candidatus Limnocylindrales bacterium]|nr:ATP-binding protein [Candidatus Limnocylindrales bacterium]